MAVRALMWDVDGVLVRHPAGRSWTSELFADLGLDPEALARGFFAPCFGEALRGRADLYELLDGVLPTLGSSLSSTQPVDYWFSHDAVLDERLLADLREARSAGVALHLATAQEHHRAGFLWGSLGLGERFDAMHYSADVGFVKTDAEFYAVVESRTGLEPSEHCLIDDDDDNVVAARHAGWQAFTWTPESRLGDVLGAVRGG